MIKRCEVCGTTEGVECEVLLKGTTVDRVYHLCSKHLVQVYRGTLEEFVEYNEYKVASFVKMNADKMIMDAVHEDKMTEYTDENGELSVTDLNPVGIMRLRPYDDEEPTEGEFDERD